MVDLGFDNTWSRDLEGTYVPAPPRGFASPELLTYDRELATQMGLPVLDDESAARLFSGSAVSPDAEPIALAYAGHQFGGFSPQLGDGRAVLLGEVVGRDGRRWDIQLKGSGPTGFSRGGDGFAALGPVLREQLVSRAMFHLGIPTTRVLATVRTGEAVFRERPLPGAVLARVASSHLRVGTFEFFAARRKEQTVARLVEYTLGRHAPEGLEDPVPAAFLLDWVADRQAELVSAWMGVGFVHGVMNTDNFTISGETLDYGPCAFIDGYDPKAVFSSIDHAGRYAFGNQPGIAQWNLARMGESLLRLIDPDEQTAVARVQDTLARFAETFTAARLRSLRAKVGFSDSDPDDAALVEELLDWMHSEARDHTNTFRALAESLRTGEPLAFDERFLAWNRRWRARLGSSVSAEVATRMDAVNPLYIPRNHLVEEALEAALEGDLEPFQRFEKVLGRPFEPQEGAERYAAPAPEGFGEYVTFCGT